MRHDRHDDVPLLSGTFTIRSPREVLLLNPLQAPLVVTLLGVSVVFTFWPELLAHAPVGFEALGVMHHIWHYALLVGSAATLVGMLAASPYRLKIELIGLIILCGALAMNLAAMLSTIPPGGPDVTGMAIAVRAGVLFGLLVRAFIIAREPTVTITASED